MKYNDYCKELIGSTRPISNTLLGQAWTRKCCDLSDAGRCARARKYLRTNNIKDFEVIGSSIYGFVDSGTEDKTGYAVEIKFEKVKEQDMYKALFDRIIDVNDLRFGMLSGLIKNDIISNKLKLFPTRKEIEASCTCLDFKSYGHFYYCKHIMAMIFLLGRIFDYEPELLFDLRGIDYKKIIEDNKKMYDIEKNNKANNNYTIKELMEIDKKEDNESNKNSNLYSYQFSSQEEAQKHERISKDLNNIFGLKFNNIDVDKDELLKFKEKVIEFSEKDQTVLSFANRNDGKIMGVRIKYNVYYNSITRCVVQYTINRHIIKVFKSIKEASRNSGVNIKSIRDCCNGIQKTAGGYVWRLVCMLNNNSNLNLYTDEQVEEVKRLESIKEIRNQEEKKTEKIDTSFKMTDIKKEDEILSTKYNYLDVVDDYDSFKYKYNDNDLMINIKKFIDEHITPGVSYNKVYQLFKKDFNMFNIDTIKDVKLAIDEYIGKEYIKNDNYISKFKSIDEIVSFIKLYIKENEVAENEVYDLFYYIDEKIVNAALGLGFINGKIKTTTKNVHNELSLDDIEKKILVLLYYGFNKTIIVNFFGIDINIYMNKKKNLMEFFKVSNEEQLQEKIEQYIENDQEMKLFAEKFKKEHSLFAG